MSERKPSVSETVLRLIALVGENPEGIQGDRLIDAMNAVDDAVKRSVRRHALDGEHL